MITAKFSSKDQNWQNGTTVYWFVLDGTDYGTDRHFNSKLFGIVDCAGDKSVVEADGDSVSNEYLKNIVLRECKITDEMIFD